MKTEKPKEIEKTGRECRTYSHYKHYKYVSPNYDKLFCWKCRKFVAFTRNKRFYYFVNNKKYQAGVFE